MSAKEEIDDRAVNIKLARHIAKTISKNKSASKPRSRARSVPITLSKSDVSMVSVAQRMNEAYDAYRGKVTSRRRYTMVGVAASCASWLVKTYVSSRSGNGMTYLGNVGGGENKWTYILMGAAFGFLLHGELRWRLGERKAAVEQSNSAYGFAQQLLSLVEQEEGDGNESEETKAGDQPVRPWSLYD